MPINPLPKEYDSFPKVFNETVPERRPDLAVLAVKLIHIHAQIDSLMAVIASGILGVHAQPIAAMLNAMKTTNTKLDGIDALAKTKLSDDDFLTFRAALSLTKPLQSSRNKLCHWIWGLAEGADDILLFWSPNERLTSENYFAEETRAAIDEGRPIMFASQNYWYISKPELEQDTKAAADILSVIAYVRALTDTRLGMQDLGRNRLLARPDIQAARLKPPK